jgi:hypothetical protein
MTDIFEIKPANKNDAGIILELIKDIIGWYKPFKWNVTTNGLLINKDLINYLIKII